MLISAKNNKEEDTIPKKDKNGLYYKRYDSTYKGQRIRFNISGINPPKRVIEKMISDKLEYERNKIDGIIVVEKAVKETVVECEGRTLGDAVSDYFNGPALNFSHNTVYAKKRYVNKYIYGNDYNKIIVTNKKIKISFTSKFREGTLIEDINIQDYNAWRKEFKDIDSMLLGTDYKNKIAYLFHEILDNENIHNDNIKFKLDEKLFPRFKKTGEETKQESVIISDKFIELFLNSYNQNLKRDKIFYFIFKFYWFLGLRRNELLALKVSDIKGREIKIDKSIIYKNGKADISTPKTKGSNRVVIMSPSLAKEIAEFIEIIYNKKDKSDLFLFSVKEGKEPLNVNAINKELSDRVDIINLEGYNFKKPSIKDFRSSGSTSKFRAAQNNEKRDLFESLTSISKQLGHSKTQTTLESYIKFQEENEDNDEKEFSEEYYNSFNFRSEVQADGMIDQTSDFSEMILRVPRKYHNFTPMMGRMMLENKKMAQLSH